LAGVPSGLKMVCSGPAKKPTNKFTISLSFIDNLYYNNINLDLQRVDIVDAFDL